MSGVISTFTPAPASALPQVQFLHAFLLVVQSEAAARAESRCVRPPGRSK